jgi:HEPN domain-containing protein
MGIDEDIQHWLRFAQSDMISAEASHRVGQELNALFHLQQAVEKTLKALLLRKSKVQPPRIHGLRGLSERCGLKLPEKQALLIENLSAYYIESRYPGHWDESPSEVTAEEVEKLIPETKEFVEWLQSQI